MTEKDILIEWIHKVEISKNKNNGAWTNEFKKRLPSLVTELFFSRNISTITNLSHDDIILNGWSCKKHKNNRREWFKITSNIKTDNDIYFQGNKKLCIDIKKTRPSDSIFILRPKLELRKSIPFLTFKLIEIYISNGGKVKKANSKYAESLESSINEGIFKNISSLIDQNSPKSRGIQKWLDNSTIDELNNIFISRCLMNFGGLFPTDIDAINYSPSKETLTFIEFKRKDPAKGTRKIPPLLAAPDKLSQYLSIIENGIRDIEFHNWPTKNGNCFGLDKSHAENVHLCQQLSIEYRYIIWNSLERELEKLLDKTFIPLTPPEIRSLSVTSESFDGLSQTRGSDSGSYTKKTRFQLMIPEERFEFIRYSAS